MRFTKDPRCPKHHDYEVYIAYDRHEYGQWVCSVCDRVLGAVSPTCPGNWAMFIRWPPGRKPKLQDSKWRVFDWSWPYLREDTMGNWNITIRGQGAHHNKGLLLDANRMAAKFVQDLRAAGHSVSHASITFGGENDLSQPTRYLDDLAHVDGSAVGPRCGHPVGAKGPCRLVEHHEGDHEPPVEWKSA